MSSDTPEELIARRERFLSWANSVPPTPLDTEFGDENGFNSDVVFEWVAEDLAAMKSLQARTDELEDLINELNHVHTTDLKQGKRILFSLPYSVAEKLRNVRLSTHKGGEG